MMPGDANFTTTACGGCGSVSDEDEGMWKEEDCQSQKKLDAESSKTGAKKKKKKTDDNSDKSSVKSDGRSGSSMERQLKALEKERKKKKQELKNERVLMEKWMEIDLQEQRIEMETEFRAKELQQQKQLLEKALKDKQDHLDWMKKMRESFNARMDQIQQKLSKLSAGEDDRKESVNKVSDTVKQSTAGATLKNPEIRSQKRSEKTKKVESDEEQEEEEDEESAESSSDDESEEQSESDSDEATEEEDEEEEPKKTSKEKNKSGKVRSHGLGQSNAAPSKAQMAARSGISKRLPLFTLKPEAWPLFIGSYQASNDACGFSDVENLVRLQESLKGQALENVRGQLLFPKSVPKVISKRRQLYGRPEQLLQCQLEKVWRLDPPKSDKLASYIPFGNAVEQLCEHLEAAGLEQHLVNPLLIQDLVDKLPAHDKREWVRYKNRKRKVNLRTFTDFVSKIVAEAYEANVKMDFIAESKPVCNEHAGKSKAKKKGAHLYNHSAVERANPGVGENHPRSCKACKRTDQRLRFCQDFKAWTLRDRLKLVEKWKLCVVCLNDHGNAPCKFKIRCNIDECRERHNPLLHSATGSVVINAHFRTTSTIMFRMIPVTLYFGKRSVNTLAFLDEGASVTLIESSLADQLGVQGTKEQLTIKWTADITRMEKGSRRMDLFISGRDWKEKHQLGTVRTVDELLLPKQSLSASVLSQRMNKLQGLPIASYENQRPGLLIGLNNLHLLAPTEAKVGKPGEPIAVRSKLGWAVYGPNEVQLSNAEVYLGHHDEVSNQKLHDLLKSQYALEDSVVMKLAESEDDRRAREIFERTTRRIKEYQQKGYAHLASAEELEEAEPGKVWYLPLNVVLNPKKPGKVRLVWDAAASVKGISLNSLLLTGPDLLVCILTVFCQFRERPIVFGGDIREMYHQMQIRPADRRVQRFVFRSNPREAPSIYVMDVATFGSKSSPCSAQFVKNKNAMEFAVQYPEAAAAIVKKQRLLRQR
ncbi:uncharacterized protein LOC135702787 [Ochlerotatus camptorhynchus]|uniref:uncharacterized protein LOC135702787 n=1 Tax=Ochlerotatus camptorhynchus TaxID=644619 RepID=UPI0031E40731